MTESIRRLSLMFDQSRQVQMVQLHLDERDDTSAGLVIDDRPRYRQLS